MKKNHLDFKDLAQSLAMDKGKLERYVTVRFLLKLFNNPVRFIAAVRMLFCTHMKIGPHQQKKCLPHLMVQ